MSEATLRFRLYGAIDDAIVADNSLIVNAAEVLPNYVMDRDDLVRQGRIQNKRRPVMTDDEWRLRNPQSRELLVARASGARDEPSAATVAPPSQARLYTTTLGWMGAFSQLQPGADGSADGRRRARRDDGSGPESVADRHRQSGAGVVDDHQHLRRRGRRGRRAGPDHDALVRPHPTAWSVTRDDAGHSAEGPVPRLSHRRRRGQHVEPGRRARGWSRRPLPS